MYHLYHNNIQFIEPEILVVTSPIYSACVILMIIIIIIITITLHPCQPHLVSVQCPATHCRITVTSRSSSSFSTLPPLETTKAVVDLSHRQIFVRITNLYYTYRVLCLRCHLCVFLRVRVFFHIIFFFYRFDVYDIRPGRDERPHE